MNDSTEKPEIPAGERILHMKISPKLKRRLLQEAIRENRTLSNFITTLFIKEINNRDKHTE